MIHRKKEHPNIVKECSKYKEQKCGFQDEFCWFIHSIKIVQDDKKNKNLDDGMEIDGEDEAVKSVFYQAQKKPKPPSKE